MGCTTSAAGGARHKAAATSPRAGGSSVATNSSRRRGTPVGVGLLASANAAAYDSFLLQMHPVAERWGHPTCGHRPKERKSSVGRDPACRPSHGANLDEVPWRGG